MRLRALLGLASFFMGHAAAQESALEEVTVTGFRREYLSQAADVGVGADINDTPLSIMVVPQDILADQQVNNVEDALRNVASVTKFKQGNGGEEKFSIRGFDAAQSLYKDGARLNNRFNATNIATTETANIERYEVLKGPAAILYGQGEPGGVINYVTKKPQFEPYAALEIIGGSDEYGRVEGDITGAAGSAAAYRFVGSYENSDSFRDEIARERLLLNPSLLWRLGEDTQLSASAEYIADDYTQDRGQALAPNADGSFGYPSAISPRTFLGVPGWNERTNSDYRRGQLTFTHRFNEIYSVEALGSYTTVDKQLFDSSPRTQEADGRFRIGPSYQEGESAQTYVKLSNMLTLGDPRSIEHRVLLAGTYEHIENDGASYDVTTPEVIYYDPFADSYTDTVLTIDRSTPFDLATDEVEYGLVAQDLMVIDERHYVLAGVSYRSFENREEDFEASDVAPRVGYLWRANDQLALYASYARGFVPTSLEDRDGNVLDPETAEQSEIGIKLDLLDQNLSITGALFDVRKFDVAYTDPASLSLPPAEQWSASFGETRTRGAEVQVVGKVSDTIRVISGYSYLDNEITRGDPEAGTTGNVLPGIPRHSGSLWAVYEIQRGPLAGLGFGAGVFAQSDVFIGLENRSTYGGWTQVDMSAYYKWDEWKVQLNAKNVFDREYYLTQALAAESLAAVRVGTSSPASAVLSIAREF